MFDSVRKHQRLMLGLLLLLIFPAFVLFGLSGYDKMAGGRDDVAVVEGTRISRGMVEEAHRRQVEQMRGMLGDQVDVRLFDTPEARARTLESLITQQALLADANKRHVTVLPPEIQKAVMAIQAFHGPDGKFSFEQYQLVLAQNQRTPQMFEAEVAQELRLQAVGGALQESAFGPRSVADRLFTAQESRRTLRTRTIDPKSLESGLSATDEQLRAYYDRNSDRYRLPESIDVDYLVLDRSKLAPQGKPSEDELRAYYEQNRSRYSTAESRRASHILITVPSGADSAAKAAARKKAEDLLAQVKADPGRFAELAKANSQDPGSAEQGGDLGVFDRDMMVKPFADAAFAAKAGEITPLVESEFGFHVIRVTEAKTGGTTPFDEVRDRLTTTWNEQQGAKRYSEQAEQFRNTVYEQPESLDAAAKRFGLEVQKASNVLRSPAPGSTGPMANARVLGQLFAEDSLRNNRNIEATEISPGMLVSARVTKHHASRLQPFDEVKEAVRAQWTLDEAARLAREQGEALVKTLNSRDSNANATEVARFDAETTVTRSTPGNLSSQAASAAFALPADKLPAYTGVDLGRAGYQLIRVEKAEAPSADAQPKRERYITQYDQTVGQSATAIWIQDVLARMNIERKRLN